jgi:hypothetical protein
MDTGLGVQIVKKYISFRIVIIFLEEKMMKTYLLDLDAIRVENVNFIFELVEFKIQ